MGDDDKPFGCNEPDCGMRFTNEDHLTVHRKKHEMTLNLGSGGSSAKVVTGGLFIDQTPTPTRFIRNCEEVGLFQDIQNLNPFEEQFRKASEAVKSGASSLQLQPAISLGIDSLNTPQLLSSTLDGDIVDTTALTPDVHDQVSVPDPDVTHPLPESAQDPSMGIPSPNSPSQSGAELSETGVLFHAPVQQIETHIGVDTDDEVTVLTTSVGETTDSPVDDSPANEVRVLSHLAEPSVSSVGESTLITYTSGVELGSDSRSDVIYTEAPIANNSLFTAKVIPTVVTPVVKNSSSVTPNIIHIPSVITTPSGAVGDSQNGLQQIVLSNFGAQTLQLATVGSPSASAALPVLGASTSPAPIVQILLKMPDGRSIPLSFPGVPIATAPTIANIPLATQGPAVAHQTVPQTQSCSTGSAFLTKLKLKQALSSHHGSNGSALNARNVEEGTTNGVSKHTIQASEPVSVVDRGSSQCNRPTSIRRRRSSEDDPDEKRRRFLERNRAAATRCREKRKNWIYTLERKADELAQANQQLQSEVTMLRTEVASLKLMLLAHRDCPVTLQQNSDSNGLLTPELSMDEAAVEMTSAEAIASTALTCLAQTTSNSSGTMQTIISNSVSKQKRTIKVDSSEVIEIIPDAVVINSSDDEQSDVDNETSDFQE